MAYITIAAALILALVTSQASEAKKVIGWVEKVCVLPEKVIVTAKIDSGADNSCLDVRDNSSNAMENSGFGSRLPMAVMRA
jgi:hypothetical protein